MNFSTQKKKLFNYFIINDNDNIYYKLNNKEEGMFELYLNNFLGVIADKCSHAAVNTFEYAQK